MPELTMKILIVTCLFVTCISACSVTKGWRALSMEERLFLFDIVVTGTDMEHVGRQEFGSEVVDSKFHVSCVLKGDRQTIKENITILGIEPLNSCQATELEVGESYIVGLTRSASDYRLHDVNVMQTIAFRYTDDNLRRALTVCGVQTPIAPSGATVKKNMMSCPDVTLVEPCFNGVENFVGQKLFVIMVTVMSVFSLD